MSNDVKEQIRGRLDIADVVGEIVALKPSGRGQLKGLCPFHSEKTPSFSVSQDRGFYYCFGCQAKGDIFDFVMQSQGVDFFEAMQYLGQRAGIEVVASIPTDKKSKDLYEVNAVALEFFKSQLVSHPFAHEYLFSRKLTEDSIDAFDLGYAQDSWDAFLKLALTKGLNAHDLLAAGLIRENDSGRQYDYFRNRIIFPIKDYMGRVVGFSGRVLDNSLPKYLNTAETDIFKKAELLYGLDIAKTEIRSSGECLVVEGYMDVIALHQTGFANAVAALGATLTLEQATQLSRLDVQKLYLAFDADEAGQRAILGGLEQSVGRQFLVQAIRVPFGKDPADAVLEGHIEDFKKALGQGLSEVEFRFQSVLAKYDKTTVEGKKNILNELLPALRPRDVFDSVAQETSRLVVEQLKIDAGRLNEWVNSKRRRSINDTQVRGMERPNVNHSKRAVIELEMIALMLFEPRKLEQRLTETIADLPSFESDALLQEFFEICTHCQFDSARIFAKYQERTEGKIIFKRLFEHGATDGETAIDIDACLKRDAERLRDMYLTQIKESQRIQFLEERAELLERIHHTDGNNEVEVDDKKDLYADLARIRDMQRAREAERRMRVSDSFLKKNKKKSSY